MSVQEPDVDLLFRRLQASTSEIGFTNCLNLLEPKLIAQLVQTIVDLIKEDHELVARVSFGNLIEVIDFNKDGGYLILIVQDAFFVLLVTIPNHRWYEDVENRFKLYVASHFSMSINELSFLLKLLDIDVAGPD